MSDSKEQATDVPLHERMYRFAFNARRLGTKATEPGEHHVCTPVFDDGHGFAMFPISMFEEAAVLLERQSQRAPAPSESPSPATVTDGEREARAEDAYPTHLAPDDRTKSVMQSLKTAYLLGCYETEVAVGPALARLAELEAMEQRVESILGLQGKGNLWLYPGPELGLSEAKRVAQYILTGATDCIGGSPH